MENLKHQIKLINNSFTTLSVEKLKIKFNNDKNLIINNIDGCICCSLFLRDIHREKLNCSSRINYLYFFYSFIYIFIFIEIIKIFCY